jgi:serine/threonine-protein kinase
MKTRSDPCDPDRLRLLAEDRLAPAELAELEQHLEQCANCRDALDQLVSDDRCLGTMRRYLDADPTVFLAPVPATDESLDFLAPSDWPDSLGRLGTHEVKGVLGRGGMGVVLKAFDPALNRNVAIKVMSAPLASCSAARHRFLREARAAAAVVHEHVVAVFAVAEAAGLPFLVMEYVPGRSLQERLDKRGPLTVPEVLRIGMQTAAGLAAAHAQGLVHRDIKPANILLEDGVERVRLTDFGLARAADAAMTHSGVVVGTPHYMAPEQARGETTDYRADLFSLGSTLYATCAGHPPFRAETPLAALRRVCDDEPRPLRAINPDVPRWLEAIVARLMSKDPARRYQTAIEVSELLARCLAHVQQPLVSPLPAALDSPKPQRARPRLARRYGAILAIALAVALTTGSIIYVSTWAALQLATGERANLSSPLSTHRTSNDQVPQLGSADVQRLIDQARNRAQMIEADLRSHRESSGRDVVSERSHAIAVRAEALAREIIPDHIVPTNATNSLTIPNQRR